MKFPRTAFLDDFVILAFLTRGEVYFIPRQFATRAQHRMILRKYQISKLVRARQTAILQHFSTHGPSRAGVRWKMVLRGILIEITTELSYKRGVRRESRRELERNARERSFSRVCFFFLLVAHSSCVCYAQCVASTRRSKFNVCNGVRFGRLPQAASLSGLPESCARAISREREFSLWRRVVVRLFVARLPSPVRVVRYVNTSRRDPS